jgi:hypothetical protein
MRRVRGGDLFTPSSYLRLSSRSAGDQFMMFDMTTIRIVRNAP